MNKRLITAIGLTKHESTDGGKNGAKDSPDLHLYTAHSRLCPLDTRNCNLRRIVCFVVCFWFPSIGGRIGGRLYTCRGGSRGTRIGDGKLASAELRGHCVRPRPPRRCRRRRRMRSMKRMSSGCSRNRICRRRCRRMEGAGRGRAVSKSSSSSRTGA